MSLSDFGWAKYPLGALVVLALIAVLGLPYLAYARKRLPENCALIAPVVGMAALIVGVSWYGLLGERLSGLLIWLIAAIVLGFFVVRTMRRRTALKPLGREFGGYAVPWGIGLILATIFMLPAISSPLVGGSVTSFASGNNDIGSYIAEATNLAESGYDNVGWWYKWDPGSDPNGAGAKADHTGANAMLAAVSAILHKPVWQIGTIALMVVFASMLAGAVALARSFMTGAKTTTLVVGVFAGTTALVWYLSANFFFGQLVCISMILSQLVLVQAAIRTGPDWRLFIPLGLLTAANILSSPEVGSLSIALMAALVVAQTGGSLLARAPARPLLRRLFFDSAVIAAGLALALLLVAPFLSDQIGRTQRVAGFGIIGWSFDLRNLPSTLLGLDTIGTPRTPLSTLLWVLAAIALVAAFVWAFKKRKTNALIAGVFAAAMFVIVCYGANRWGVIAYQSWKLIATLSIPFVVAAMVLILRPLNAKWQMGVLAVAVALVGVNVSTAARSWEVARVDAKTLRNASVPRELADFLKSGQLQQQTGINVYLPSGWLTMAAPAIYEHQGALSSPSYLSGGQPGLHPYSCSLYERSMYMPTKRQMKRQEVVAMTANYLLVGTPTCK